MGINKNALIRYKVLDSCFRNRARRYFIDDLIKACEKTLLEKDPNSGGISRRQIFEDIAFMESSDGWGINLNKNRDGKKVYYQYSDPSFSINNMPLNELEIHQLKSALDVLSQFKGMPQFEWITQLIPKLDQGINKRQEVKILMDFDNNQYLKGIEHLGPLYNAILFEKVLEVSYQPYQNKAAYSMEIHPYFLKQYNNRWFLFGFNKANQKFDWNLAIDRIVSFKEIKAVFNKNTQINWNAYFDEIIGVTKPQNKQPEQVVLIFFGQTGHYIESKPIHGSQKSRWVDENTLEVRLDLIINYELERLILSYAENIRVHKPDSLVKLIRKRLADGVNIYHEIS